jgi:hypothetical protein
VCRFSLFDFLTYICSISPSFFDFIFLSHASPLFAPPCFHDQPVSQWFKDDDAEDDYNLTTLDVLLETQLPVILQVTLIALLPLLFTFLSELYDKAKSQSEVYRREREKERKRDRKIEEKGWRYRICFVTPLLLPPPHTHTHHIYLDIYIYKQKVQRSVLSRYYGFTLVNILSTFGVRNLLDVLKAILKEPSCLVDLLGSSIPGNASYFAQYIIIKILLGLPLELW